MKIHLLKLSQENRTALYNAGVRIIDSPKVIASLYELIDTGMTRTGMVSHNNKKQTISRKWTTEVVRYARIMGYEVYGKNDSSINGADGEYVCFYDKKPTYADLVDVLKKISELSEYDPNHDEILYNFGAIKILTDKTLKQIL